MTIRYLEQKFLHTAYLCLETPVDTQIYQVNHLVVLLLSRETQEGLHHALRIVEHVKATLASSVLLQYWDVPYLCTDVVGVKFYSNVRKDFLELDRLDLLQAITNGRFLIIGVHLVVVSLHDPLILAHGDVRDQVYYNLAKEVKSLFFSLLSVGGHRRKLTFRVD